MFKILKYHFLLCKWQFLQLNISRYQAKWKETRFCRMQTTLWLHCASQQETSVLWVAENTQILKYMALLNIPWCQFSQLVNGNCEHLNNCLCDFDFLEAGELSFCQTSEWNNPTNCVSPNNSALKLLLFNVISPLVAKYIDLFHFQVMKF